MPRSGIVKEDIVRVAAQIIEESGEGKLTLREVSERLDIKSPSLYNHVGGLAELKDEVSLYVMERLREYIVRSTIGRTGLDAMKAMGHAFIRFAKEHARLYETVQWMNIGDNVGHGSLFADVVQLVYDTAGSLGVSELEASHIIRTVRSLAQGFASVEVHGGFSHPSSIESSFEYAVDMFFLGVKTHQEGGKVP
jgi:AcrR family transcriptional regulator